MALYLYGKFNLFFFLSALRVDKDVLFSLRNCLIVFHAFVRNCLELIPLMAVFCLFQNTIFTCVHYCFSQVLFIGLCSIQKYECISALLSQYVGCLLFHFEVIWFYQKFRRSLFFRTFDPIA